MSSDLKKGVKEIVDDLRKRGYEVGGEGKHPVLRAPGKNPVTIPTSPSDWRALKNLRAQLKREGYLTEEEPVKKHIRTKGAAVPVAQDLRDALNKALREMGDNPDAKAGSKGGARSAICRTFDEAGVRLGLSVPKTMEGRMKWIRVILAGDPLAEDAQNIVRQALFILKETPADASTFQGVSERNGIKKLTTYWRCSICHQSFESDLLLKSHQRQYHSELMAGPPPRNPQVEVETERRKDSTLWDALHLRVLAAILDPNVDRNEAVSIAEEVRSLVETQ